MYETRLVKIDDKGRLVVPASLRFALGLRAGGELWATIEGGALVMRPVEENPGETHEHGTDGRPIPRTP